MNKYYLDEKNNDYHYEAIHLKYLLGSTALIPKDSLNSHKESSSNYFDIVNLLFFTLKYCLKCNEVIEHFPYFSSLIVHLSHSKY